jgi:hypothetical protein
MESVWYEPFQDPFGMGLTLLSQRAMAGEPTRYARLEKGVFTPAHLQSFQFHPLSQSGSNLTEAGGIGYTIVDSLDSLLLMGFDEEYERGRDWVANDLSFEADANFNSFEVSQSSSPVYSQADEVPLPDYYPYPRRAARGALSDIGSSYISSRCRSIPGKGHRPG